MRDREGERGRGRGRERALQRGGERGRDIPSVPAMTLEMSRSVVIPDCISFSSVKVSKLLVGRFLFFCPVQFFSD